MEELGFEAVPSSRISGDHLGYGMVPVLLKQTAIQNDLDRYKAGLTQTRRDEFERSFRTSDSSSCASRSAESVLRTEGVAGYATEYARDFWALGSQTDIAFEWLGWRECMRKASFNFGSSVDARKYVAHQVMVLEGKEDSQKLAKLADLEISIAEADSACGDIHLRKYRTLLADLERRYALRVEEQ